MTLDDALTIPGAQTVGGSVETDHANGRVKLGTLVHGIFHPTPEAIAAHENMAERALDAIIVEADQIEDDIEQSIKAMMGKPRGKPAA